MAKALDTLSHRLRVPVDDARTPAPAAAASAPRRRRGRRGREAGRRAGGGRRPGRRRRRPRRRGRRSGPADLDPIDRELIADRPERAGAVGRLISRVAVAVDCATRPLRAILQACYDLHGEGQPPTFDRVALRLDDPAVRALAAGLLLPIDAGPAARGRAAPAPWQDRLDGRPRRGSTSATGRIGSGTCKAALDETDRDCRPGRVPGLADRNIDVL